MKQRTPFVFLLSLGLLIVMFSATTALIYEDYELSDHGEETTATIEGLEYVNRTKQGRETYFHAITFGAHYATLGLDSPYPAGTQVQVTYLPETPERVKPGNLRNKSMLDILSGGVPMTGYLLCLVMLAITVANFVSYRKGRD